MTAPLPIRACREGDLPAIQAIYAPYVAGSTVSFELAPPDLAEITARWRSVTGQGLPWLVAEQDGAVAAYAYATPYRPRPAYRFAVENSVYVRHGLARRGIGRAVMTALIEACAARGLRQMVAIIGGADNTASIALHAGLGFRTVGVLAAIGHKLERWQDVTIMQRALGPGDRAPPEAALQSS